MIKNILFLLLLFISCRNNCEKLYLTKDESNWILPFKQGRSYLYKSNLEHIDTMKTKEIRRFHSECNSNEVSNYQTETFDAEFFFCSNNDRINNQDCYILVRKEDSSIVKPFIDVMNLKFPNERSEIEVLDIKLNSRFYKSVFKVRNYNKDSFIKEFIWSKENGLISYLTIDNELFEIYGELR